MGGRRRTDGDTCAPLEASTIRLLHRKIFFALYHYGPMTALPASLAVGKTEQTVTTRFEEMLKRGLATNAGKAKNLFTNRSAIVRKLVMGHPTIPTSFAEFMTMSKEYRAINREDREAFRAVLRGMLDELDKFDQLDEGK